MIRRKRTRADGWVNYLTGIGTEERDKSQASTFEATFAGKIDDFTLEALYREDYLCRLIVSRLPEECFRTGFRFKHESGEDLAPLRKAWRNIVVGRDYAGPTVQAIRAWRWARLFGGAAVWVGADDSPEAQAFPLDLTKVKSVRFFRVLDRRSLVSDPGSVDTENPGNPLFNEPSKYIYTPPSGGKAWTIHASRLVFWPGHETPQRERASSDYWDTSVLADVYPVIRSYGTVWAGIENILQDNAQGVLQIKNLIAMITAKDRAQLKARLETLDMTRSNVRAMVLDKDNEDFRREVTNLAGMSDLIIRINERLSSAAEMPLTVLFGISPAGLNATGESDLRLFYDKLETKRETTITPRLLRMAAPVAASVGIDPAGLSIEWDSAWSMTKAEAAAYRKTVAETDAIYIGSEVFTAEDVAKARSVDGAWSDAPPEPLADPSPIDPYGPPAAPSGAAPPEGAPLP